MSLQTSAAAIHRFQGGVQVGRINRACVLNTGGKFKLCTEAGVKVPLAIAGMLETSVGTAALVVREELATQKVPLSSHLQVAKRPSWQGPPYSGRGRLRRGRTRS